MWSKIFHLIVAFVVLSIASLAEPTYFIVDLIKNPSPGNIFIGDGYSDNGIFNNYSRIIDSAKLAKIPAGIDFHIQPSGAMTYYDLTTSKFYKLNNSYKVIDSFAVANNGETDFHEFLLNTDGSYYLIANRVVTVDMSEIVQNGNTEAFIYDPVIQKYNSNKQLIWSFSLFDNLPFLDANDQVDFTAKSIDPYHVNSIDADPFGNIYLSIRNFNQIVKINVASSSIVWRLGGSKSKNNQFTFLNDEIEEMTGISNTHDARYLPNGNIIVFDNGNTRNTQFSRAVEYKIDETAKTAEKVWEYIPQPNIFAPIMGSVQRLPNGNTFMLFANQLIEANKLGETVFRAIKTKGAYTYRAYKYPYKIATVQKAIKNTGNYDFVAAGNLTYVKMNVQFNDKEGYINVTRHDYKPQRYTFNELEPSRIINQRWVVESNINFTSKVTIDLNNFTDYVKGDSIVAYARDNEDKSSFKRITTSFNRTTKIITLDLSSDCEFILTSNEQIINSKPDLLLPRNYDITSRDVTFKWYPIQYSENYEFQLSDRSDFSTLIANPTDLTSTSFTMPNLINGRSYVWRVRATSGLSTSQWSDTWNLKIIMATPKLVFPANNTKAIQLTSSLRWNHVLQSSYYDIQVATDKDFTSLVVDAKGKLDSTIALSNLAYRTTYYWRVRAGNTEAVTPWSQENTFRTELKVPNVIYPSNNSNAIPTQINLDFEHSDEADYYQIVLDNNDFNGNTINLIVNNKQPEVKINLEEYNNYVVKIRSIAYQDTSRWSEITHFKTIIQKPVLKFPPRFMLLVPIPTLFIIEDVKDATGYEFNIVSSLTDISQGEKQILDTIFTSNLSNFNVTFLEKKTTNKWRARTLYIYGKSDWSNFNEFSIGTTGVLNAPSLTLPINNSTSIPVNGILNWENTSSDIKNYRILFAEDENFNNIVFDQIVENNSFYYKNLLYNKQYYWKVAATKDGEFSQWTDTWKFTTKNVDFISTPKLIYPENNVEIKTSKIEFVWEKLAFAVGYHLQTSNNEDFSNVLIDEKDLPGYSFEIENLQSNSTYYWRVQAKAKDSTDYGKWSETYKFSTSELLSIVEFDDLKIDEKELIIKNNFEVKDIVGKTIIMTKEHYSDIDEIKSELIKGVYFLVSKSEKENFKAVKLVVN